MLNLISRLNLNSKKVNLLVLVSIVLTLGLFSRFQEIVRLLMHIHHPAIYNEVGIDPPRGFLLHGPPGCGKTMLAHAVAGVSSTLHRRNAILIYKNSKRLLRMLQQLKVPLLDVAAPELVAGVSGISEQRIRKLFDNAIKQSPCILFIDEIDCITQNRDVANRDMERRIVSQLLSSMDSECSSLYLES